VLLPVHLHSVKEHFFSFAVLWMSTGQQGGAGVSELLSPVRRWLPWPELD
jgi:hypothetical protein